jgi:hypothetical protein
MSNKVTKKMYDNLIEANNKVKEAKKIKEKASKDIIKVVEPIISKYYKNEKTGWDITGVSFERSEYMYDKKQNQIVSKEYEWVDISEDEYYDLVCNGKSSDELKQDWKNMTFQKRKLKKFEYLRVYVHEHWGYGGYDDVVYDFFLKDIMDDTYLRKEKLEKIQLRKMKELSSFLDDEIKKVKEERKMREDSKKYNL